MYVSSAENTSEKIAELFEKARQILAESDSDWSEWTVELLEDKDSLSIKPGAEKKIVVGAQRRAAANDELQGLFGHEVLVHAQRSLNGRKKSDILSTGLPGYLDFEEGLGTFFEYAITGKIPQKNVDRYVDIAIGVGLMTDSGVSRITMMKFATAREILRAQLAETVIDETIIKSKVAAHINRLYRGTTGDAESIGLFTKDIAYQKGFEEAGEYIADRLEAGESIENIIMYLLEGKFNPLDKRHVEYVDSVS